MDYLIITFILFFPTLAFAVAGVDKTPEMYSVLTYGWVIGISVAGGVSSFISKIKRGHIRSFNIFELIGELVISGFAGVITFWLCESAGLDQLMTAAFVGISGHMGSRGLFFFERVLQKQFDRIFNFQKTDNDGQTDSHKDSSTDN